MQTEVVLLWQHRNCTVRDRTGAAATAETATVAAVTMSITIKLPLSNTWRVSMSMTMGLINGVHRIRGNMTHPPRTEVASETRTAICGRPDVDRVWRATFVTTRDKRMLVSGTGNMDLIDMIGLNFVYWSWTKPKSDKHIMSAPPSPSSDVRIDAREDDRIKKRRTKVLATVALVLSIIAIVFSIVAFFVSLNARKTADDAWETLHPNHTHDDSCFGARNDHHDHDGDDDDHDSSTHHHHHTTQRVDDEMVNPGRACGI
jgi:hypothetical protein